MNAYRRSPGGTLRFLQIFRILLFPAIVLAHIAPVLSQGDVGKKNDKPSPSSPEDRRREEFRRDWKFQGDLAYKYILELRTLGKYRLVQQHISEFLTLFPGHERSPAVHTIRGDLYLKIQRPSRAIIAYLELYSQYPDTKQGARAALQAGRLLIRQGNRSRAEKALRNLMERHPASKYFRLAEIELDSLRFLDSQAGNRKNAVKQESSGSGSPIKNKGD